MKNTIQLPFNTSHAFLIGIDDYQHLTSLSTAVNDARVIAQRLEDQHGFTVHPPLLNATHADIHKLLTEDIPRLVGADDRVLFYFAGHGIALDGETGPNGYLVAADTRPGQEETLLPMQTLHDAITGLPCRHGLLILDCCFSGAFKWSSGFRDVIFDLPKVIYEERFWRYCKDPAWQVITSSAHDQKAVDIITNQSLGLREEGNGRHSPFATSLLEALDGAGDVIPAGTGDGVMTATEIYSYLRDEVETQTTENAKRQSPSLFNLQKHDKGEFIFLNPRHRFNLPPTPDRNPFMGLSSYGERDASLFFGRDRVVSTLLDKISANSLTVVSGASGTGKSSVIKAGVLPRLRQAGRTILPIIRPGKEPLQVLKTELPDIAQQLADSAPVLVVDQYEELITQCLDPKERIAFEKQLAKWLNTYPDLDIILSVRSDFEPQFESKALAPWWSAGRYVVPAFSLDELREVVSRPAAQAVLFYEPEELIDEIVEEVSQSPGALPLLSFTLSELYHAYLKSGREDRSLSQQDYEQLGGVIGALRTRADAEYNALSPAGQDSMRKLMLRMVSVKGGEVAGKRVYAEELQFTAAAENDQVQRIADQLVDARLLLKGTDGQGRTYIEPAHDALVRAWARLWEWVKAVGEGKLDLLYKLSLAVGDYQRNGKKDQEEYLWNDDPRLDLLAAELSTTTHYFNAAETSFLQSSMRLRRSKTRKRRVIVGVIIAVLLVISAFALLQSRTATQEAQRADEQAAQREIQAQLAEDRAKEAQDSARVAQEQRLLADSALVRAQSSSLANQSLLRETTDPTIAFRLAEKALDLSPDNPIAIGALFSAFHYPGNPSIEFFYREEASFPDLAGTIAPDPAQAAKHATIDAARLALIGASNVNWGILRSQIISPGGKYMAILHLDQHGPPSIEIWDIPTGERLVDYEAINNDGRSNQLKLSKASFSRDDRYLAVPNGSVIEVWDLQRISYQKTPALLLKGPVDFVEAIYSEQGDRVYGLSNADSAFSWNMNNDYITIGDPSIYYDIEVGMVFYDPTQEQFIIDWSDAQATRVEIWNRNGKRVDNFPAGALSITEDNKTLQLNGQTHRDLSALHLVFDLGQNQSTDMFTNFTTLDQRYRITSDPAGKSVNVIPLDTTRSSILLEGVEARAYEVLIPANDPFIITTSRSAIRFWDWSGNNFFSLDYGGQLSLLPDGKTLVFKELPQYEYYPIGGIKLIDIAPDQIRKWVAGKDVYQLTRKDELELDIE